MRWSSGRLEVAGGGVGRRSVRTIWGLAFGMLALVGACATAGQPKQDAVRRRGQRST